MDEIIFCDGADIRYLAIYFGSAFKSGCDEPVSPQESEQSKRRKDCGEDGEEKGGSACEY